jgi:hypothetical protein
VQAVHVEGCDCLPFALVHVEGPNLEGNRPNSGCQSTLCTWDIFNSCQQLADHDQCKKPVDGAGMPFAFQGQDPIEQLVTHAWPLTPELGAIQCSAQA